MEATGSSLTGILVKLKALKDEHRPLVAKIAADPGMDPEVRREILDHVMEEEEELIARGLGQATAAAADTGAEPRLTVGSLRRAGRRKANRRGTVGSLRND